MENDQLFSVASGDGLIRIFLFLLMLLLNAKLFYIYMENSNLRTPEIISIIELTENEMYS